MDLKFKNITNRYIEIHIRVRIDKSQDAGAIRIKWTYIGF